jgi:predicted GTPase
MRRLREELVPGAIRTPDTAVAAIRKRLGGSFTPQQVRRILERNGPKVAVTDDRPATYRLR